MSLYGRYLLPRLLDAAMRAPQLADLRRRAAGAARGVVLELGFGTGRNLPFYDPVRVERLLALEPEPRLVALARQRLASAPFPVEVIEAGAEAIPLPDASVDTVLCTWTLCSVPRVEEALAESRRVLRAGGRFLFAEHGLSPEPRVARMQLAITPLWSRCAGGCRLDRRPDALLADAGFSMEAVAARSLGRPKLLTWMTEGVALSPAGARPASARSRRALPSGSA